MTDKEKEFQAAWYDYCITNRLIAYGEVPELTEEQIEARCMEQLKKDLEELRRKYDEEIAELDCQMNRNKACYSCANATERCFENEIGCPCEKYKSYKDENAELKEQNVEIKKQFTKARELLTKWVELFKPKGTGKDMVETDLATIAYMQGAERYKPKWHKVADGDLPKDARYVWTNVGAGYHDDDGWWDDFGRLQNVIAWCEPKFEE